ncbi:MAG: restriction endonuclease subunit S [Lewinellaceae bacterium]|nr:restriction endonuclease subunit S [Lewinellaceae bacterium]
MDKTQILQLGYKDSKIGIIPRNWDLKEIGEIAKIQTGNKDTQNKIEEGKYPFFVRSQTIERINSFSFDGEAVLTSGDGVGVGKIYHYINGKFDFHQRVYNIHGFYQQVSGKFFYHYFSQHFYKRAIRLSAKNSVDSVRMEMISKMLIPIPPLPEQKKIAEILSNSDKAIDHTQNLIEQLKLRKKGLMQQLLTGRKRLKGFSGEWKKVSLGKVASHYSQKNSNNEKIEVLSCTKYDGLVKSLDYFGRKVFGDDLSKYKIVPKGYFAYATNHIEEGSIGYQDILEKGLVSPMYTVFKTNELVDDSFLYRLLKTDRMIYQYQSNMSGSIARRGGLRWNVFETLDIKIPSKNEQVAISNFFDTIDKELSYYEKFLDNLKLQKKGLMQKLLTGQIRVAVNP